MYRSSHRSSSQGNQPEAVRPDSPLTMEEAAALIPGQPSAKTVYRWVTAGLRGIVLDSWFVGGRRFTNRQAIDQFNAAMTTARTGKRRPSRSHEEVRKRLKALHGI